MANPPANVHDSFFKKALADPKLAGAFLSEHLPPDVAELLDTNLSEADPGCFVDEELRQHQTDLLFRIRLKVGREALAYVLIEHKSSPDPGARLQLLRYVVRVLERHYEQNKRRLPLPPVIPVLAHHGPEGWKLSCEFGDLFGPVPEPLRPYVPFFRHALVDLTKIEDEALSADPRLRAFLKALKYARRGDLPDRIDLILAEASALEERDLYVILTYLDGGPVKIDGKVMRETLERLVPERTERIMGWLTQPYYEQGKAEGEAKGEARGEARGEAKVLARLLEKRFGALPATLRQRIFSADVASIDTWVERAFDAPTLESVFDSN